MFPAIIKEQRRGGRVPVDKSADELRQAKRRDKKVYITDIAVKKIPYVKYEVFTEEQNAVMQTLARQVLVLSKEKNNSNEVAVTCDMGTKNPLDNVGVSFGTEHEVDILSDTFSNHLIVSAESAAVVVLHNHPSTQTFSLQDIHFFILHPMIKVMAVVSNQGTVHYLKREQSFDYFAAVRLFKECIEILEENMQAIECIWLL